MLTSADADLKIYFAFSIRGEQALDPSPREIAILLGRRGQLVSNHSAGVVQYSDPMIATRDDLIYQDDMSRLKSCDLVVADVRAPSLGVGYEIAQAELMKKPVICLYHGDKSKISSMISGNRNLQLVVYDDIPDLRQKINSLLG